MRKKLGVLFPAVLFTLGMAGASAASNDSATYYAQAQGATPFHSTLQFQIEGNLSSVFYSIQPLTGSYTRPISATFTANYLQKQGLFTPGNGQLYLQIFVLYNQITAQGSPLKTMQNTVNFAFNFSDGTTKYVNEIITTPGYTDSCSPINTLQNTFTQLRRSQSDIGFDYFLLKDYCSNSGPVIIDTDGQIRWVPATHANLNTLASIITNNNKTIYTSYQTTASGQTLSGLQRIDVNTGLVTRMANLVGQRLGNGATITSVGDHNIDPGRNGRFLVGVGTSNTIGATIIETDGTNIYNYWDFRDILGNVLTKDEQAAFINTTSGDWFHQNSSTYNPADSTLIVSSRENFVIAVDYDAQANGTKGIHWIFGDKTKQWYTYNELNRYALAYSSNACPPIGQHAVSLDSSGNLMMINDGENSLDPLHQNYPGNNQTTGKYAPLGSQTCLSSAVKYSIKMAPPGSYPVGQATNTFGYGGYGNGTYFSSGYCGSAYDFNTGNGDSYLVDFAEEIYPGSEPDFPENAGSQFAQIQAIRSDETLVFDLRIPQPLDSNGVHTCGAGWNAVPINLAYLYYQ